MGCSMTGRETKTPKPRRGWTKAIDLKPGDQVRIPWRSSAPSPWRWWTVESCEVSMVRYWGHIKQKQEVRLIMTRDGETFDHELCAWAEWQVKE